MSFSYHVAPAKQESIIIISLSVAERVEFRGKKGDKKEREKPHLSRVTRRKVPPTSLAARIFFVELLLLLLLHAIVNMDDTLIYLAMSL